MPRSAGSGIVSRIHVEDLAAIIHAGIFADLEGAWPVADEEPCASAEIAQWCCKVLKMGEVPLTVDEQVTTGRRVDGRAIREKLGVKLAYPSWRSGVPASLAEENHRSF